MEQVLCGHLSGIDIIDKDSSEFLSRHIPVNQNGWNADADGSRQGGLGSKARRHDKSFHIVANHGLHQMSKFLWILLRACENHGEPVLVCDVLNVPAYLRKERIGNVGNNHSD